MQPVPGYPATTPYGRRGPYWSCDEDAAGNGIHTGVDYAAPYGARVVAARPGYLAWTSHGSAFGAHQVEVRCADGTRDFYAHLCMRVGEGDVQAGDHIGEVGAEGNVTGPHLHFERHATWTGGWSCAVVRDPAPSISWGEDEMTSEDWAKLRDIVREEIQAAKPDYARTYLAAAVDDRSEPTTVKKALRLSADLARGIRDALT